MRVRTRGAEDLPPPLRGGWVKPQLPAWPVPQVRLHRQHLGLRHSLHRCSAHVDCENNVARTRQARANMNSVCSDGAIGPGTQEAHCAATGLSQSVTQPPRRRKYHVQAAAAAFPCSTKIALRQCIDRRQGQKAEEARLGRVQLHKHAAHERLIFQHAHRPCQSIHVYTQRTNVSSFSTLTALARASMSTSRHMLITIVNARSFQHSNLWTLCKQIKSERTIHPLMLQCIGCNHAIVCLKIWCCRAGREQKPALVNGCSPVIFCPSISVSQCRPKSPYLWAAAPASPATGRDDSGLHHATATAAPRPAPHRLYTSPTAGHRICDGRGHGPTCAPASHGASG